MKKFVERLSIISQERITEEFSKIITGPDAVYGLSLIKDIGGENISYKRFITINGTICDLTGAHCCNF